MNRRDRRAEAARRRRDTRAAAISDAVALLAGLDDPTVTGATLILPSGETLYLPAEPHHATGPKQ